VGKPHLGERGILFIELSDGAVGSLAIRDEPEQSTFVEYNTETVIFTAPVYPRMLIAPAFLRLRAFFLRGSVTNRHRARWEPDGFARYR